MTTGPGLGREKVIRPAAKAADKLPVQVGLPCLAKLLGISLVAARTHADKGILVRGNPGQFILEASVQSYAAHLRKLADGRGGESAIGEATRARAKLMERQATLVEAKAAQLNGSAVLASEVEEFWSQKLRIFRQRIMATDEKLQHLTPADRRAIQAEMKDALNELAST
jgi:hypothetical protein